MMLVFIDWFIFQHVTITASSPPTTQHSTSGNSKGSADPPSPPLESPLHSTVHHMNHLHEKNHQPQHHLIPYLFSMALPPPTSSCRPWLLWFVSAFLILNSFRSVQCQCLQSQRSLLLQLKHDFNTTYWGNKIKSWNTTTKDCCKWSGVTCTGGYVTGLDISGEGIDTDGTVFNAKSALFELRNLTSLNLAQNLFDTTITPSFGKLQKLMHLNLSGAGFDGQIPIEISTLTRLVTLDITSQSFFGVKVENPGLSALVGNLTNLVDLRLRNVDLSTQSSVWSQVLSSSLPHLQVLDFAGSGISDPIHPSLQNLKSLSVIDLSDNIFRDPFPNFLANLRNLTYLKLTESGITGRVSGKIFQVPTLKFLDVSENYGLEGSFPTSVKNSSLETLNLRSTMFWKTIPDSIGQLKKLMILDLSQSHLVGEIPNSISQLINLVSLKMPSNDLNGTVPSFSRATNLRELELSNNLLTGTLLSTDWKKLTHLETILIRGNFLSGNIPTSLFGIPSLNLVTLADNHFTGFTNEAISPSSKLQKLYLNMNGLKGEFPSFIFGLQGLQELYLSSNKFGTMLKLSSLNQLKDLSSLYLSNSNLVVEVGSETGLFPQLKELGLASCGLKSIPIFLKNHTVIENLDLTGNQIQGQIPSWLWAIETLTSISLSHNRLNGIEKTNYSSGIETMDLSANLLHGELPELTSVKYLNLSSNHFNSTLVPIIKDFGPALTYLDVSKTNLYGSIPDSICKNEYLYYLDLSENFFSGAVPECLLNLEIHTLNLRKNNLSGFSDTLTAKCALEVIDLSGNNLQGNIPKSLRNCTGLKALDFSNNKLEKMIPFEYGYFESLQALNASNNKLTGPIPTSFGNLTALESLDLAKNQLTGKIPKQLANLKLLTFLNVSYNQLTGKIPDGPQFRNFTEASFLGNKGLCGAPLKNKC